jgi:hydrogenase-4 component F
MIPASILMILIIACPLLAAALCGLMKNSFRTLLITALAGFALSSCFIFLLIRLVFLSGPVQAFSNQFRADALSSWNLIILSLIFLITSLYSFPYFKHEHSIRSVLSSKTKKFCVLALLSFTSMAFVFLANNIIFLWAGIEAVTLSTAFLICLEPGPRSVEAMWKYLILCSVGVAIAFLGTLIIVASARHTGHAIHEILLFSVLLENSASLNANLFRVGLVFIIVGFGTKAGLAPMHTWKPDTYSQTPAPVAAFFAGVVSNVGIYAIIRYLPLTFGNPATSQWASMVLRGLGLLSIVIAAAFILFQKNVKRLLAYSSVEHIGIIALGFGLGSGATLAALFHTMGHSICKTLAFCATGRLRQAYTSHKMEDLHKIIHISPLWGTGLFLFILILIGVAPFSIFMSEFFLIKSAISTGRFVTLVIFLTGGVIIFTGLLRHIITMTFEDHGASKTAPQRLKVSSLEIFLVTGTLIFLFILGTWFPGPLWKIMSDASIIINGGAK